MSFRKKSTETVSLAAYEREDLFLSIVNRHADNVRAAASTDAMIQSVRSKAMKDAAFGILGVVALVGSIAYAVAQFL